VTQGVTTKATSSEKNMAAEALIGIGRMYGPISPETNASGRSEAITVKVARMVGLPTSSVAWTAARRREVQPSWKCRWMFSTTTIASSTRMPMAKMSAKSVTRFNV